MDSKHNELCFYPTYECRCIGIGITRWDERNKIVERVREKLHPYVSAPVFAYIVEVIQNEVRDGQ